MNQTNQTLENNKQDKLWNNAFISYLSSKSHKQLVTLNKNLCDKIVEQTKHIKLTRKTGSFRTMYKLEYLLFWYFENKIENTDSIKDKNNLKQLMRTTLKIINQELDNPTQPTYENDSENLITSESDSENNHKDDETYTDSGSESSSDEHEDELIFQEFKTEVYNMTESQLNESLELRHLYPTGTKQEKITALLDFGPTLPNNLSNYQLQRIVNKYKINHKSDSDNDSDYDPNDEKNNNTDSDYESDNEKNNNTDSDYESDDEKNNNTDSDYESDDEKNNNTDSDYESDNEKNNIDSDYESDSDSDSDYEPYNYKKQ